MQNLPECAEINRYIKEYLVYFGMGNTAECFEAEAKSKQANGRSIKPSNIPRNEELPRLYLMLKGDGTKSRREINLENDIKAQNKKYQ